MNNKANNQHGTPNDPAVDWFASWYATRLHAVSQGQEWPTKNSRKSLCGTPVFESPLTKWAEKRLAKGVKKCAKCEQHLSKLGASRKATTTINGNTND